MYPIPRKIAIFTILILLLSNCTFTPRPSPLAKLKIDVYAPLDPAYNEKCPDPFFILQDSNYYSYLNSSGLDFDQKGIIKYDYGNRFDNAGWRLPPHTIASFGITGLNAWCQKQDPIGLRLSLNQANYLIDHAVLKDGIATWPYDFPVSMFDIPTGFTSGFANAYILVFFTQLYAITGDERFIEFARQTANSFNVDTKDGGVRCIMADGTYFFEEYAYPQAPTVHILNGHMAAVAALVYYGLYANDPVALKLADKGIAAVRNHLEHFDAGIFSLYDLDQKKYIAYSQAIHIHFLFWMYRYTHDPFFLQYAFRWQNYARSDKYHLDIYGSSLAGQADLLTKAIVTLMDFEAALPGWSTSFALKDFAYFDLGAVKPIGAFRYFARSSFPTDYVVSTSSDASNWQEVVSVKDHHKAWASHCFDHLNARYIRLDIHRLADQETAFKGDIRVDPPAYCEEAILLVTTNDLAETDSTVLYDISTTTQLFLPTEAVIYGDLRQPKRPSAFVLSSQAYPVKLQAWLEMFNDLQHWTQLIPEDEAIDILVPGTISLPKMETAWQYFRLHLLDKSSQNPKIPIHTFSIKY